MGANYDKKLGSLGEDMAKLAFEQRGYKYLARNFYSKHGEVDLIFEKQDVIYFVEVKVRFNNDEGAIYSIDGQKLSSMKKTAIEYLKQSKYFFKAIEFIAVAIDVHTVDIE